MSFSNRTHTLENSLSLHLGEREAKWEQIIKIEESIKKLPQLKLRVKQLGALITSTELLLKESNPDWTGDHIMPRRKHKHRGPIKFGTLSIKALEVMRDGPEDGMYARAIAREVLVREGLDGTNRLLLDRTTNTLDRWLAKHRGDIVESHGEKFHTKWRVKE